MGRYRVASGGSEIADKRQCCDSKHNGKPDEEGRRSTKRRKSAVVERVERSRQRRKSSVATLGSSSALLKRNRSPVNPAVERVSSQLATEPVAFEHFSFGKLEKGWAREIFFFFLFFFGQIWLYFQYFVHFLFFFFLFFNREKEWLIQQFLYLLYLLREYKFRDCNLKIRFLVLSCFLIFYSAVKFLDERFFVLFLFLPRLSHLLLLFFYVFFSVN